MSPLPEHTEEQNSKPGYFAVIPANVRYCKQLPPCARLLYGEITALANKYGYCWAKNEYFADLYEVDVSTIVRWLDALKNLGFIFVDSRKDGFTWKRKIWISKESQEMFTKVQKCTVEHAKKSVRACKNASPLIIDKNSTLEKETNNNKEKPPKADVVDFFFSKEELEKLKDFTPAQIEQATRITNRDCNRKTNESRVKFFFSVVEGLKKKKPKLSIYEELCSYFKEDGKYSKELTNWQIECILNENCISFQRGPYKQTQIELNKFFSWDSIEKMCLSFGKDFIFHRD